MSADPVKMLDPETMKAELALPAASPEEAERVQLQAEKLGKIGGTDAAVIALEAAGEKPPFGKTGFDVWARLTGRAPEVADTDRLEMGRLLEDPIATRFTRKTGLQTAKVPHVVHPRYPWAAGHLDRAVLGVQPGDLEIKTVEFDPLSEWSLEGEAQRVPMAYFFQAVWYAGLPRDGLGAFERMIHIAAQFGLSGALRVYQWRPDQQVQAIHSRMFEAAQRFYENYVLKDEPPPMPTYDAEGARRWLAYKHPAMKDREIQAGPPDMVDLAKAYEDAQEKAAAWKAEKDRLGNELARIVGDHYGAMASVGGEIAKVTWPTIPEQTEAVTDYAGVLLDLGVDVPAEVIQNRTRIVTTRKAYRRLSVSVKLAGKGKR